MNSKEEFTVQMKRKVAEIEEITSRLFGDETEALCPFMAALEMIHTYSLVHDDLPAMDNDEYRRGRKTTQLSMEKIWGYWQGMHF